MVRTTIDAVVDPLNAHGRWSSAGGEDHVAMGLGREVTMFLGEDQLRAMRDECDRLLLVKAHMDIDRENEEMGWLDTADEGLQAVSTSTPG